MFGQNSFFTNLNASVTQTLSCEEVLQSLPNDGIHEGQISLTHGFVPYAPSKESLPKPYAVWDSLQAMLPNLLAHNSERNAIAHMPLLDASDPLQLPNEYLARAASILGNLAHAYYYNQRLGTNQKEDPLPDCVKVPWEQVNARIGRRFEKDNAELYASRSCFDIFIANFRVINPDIIIDGKNNLTIQGDDLALINVASATQAERGNNITFILAEIRFAPALKWMIEALKAVQRKDDQALIESFKNITDVLEKVTEALDYLTPNEHSTHYVDQVVWTKMVAAFDGKIPGGHAGLSGSEFPMFHTLDIFFERASFNTDFGKAFAKKMDMQPPNIAKFLFAMKADFQTLSIKNYVKETKNPLLRNHYQAMLDAFLHFMFIHRTKAYGYLQINFLNARPLTNGGNSGEKRIYNHFVSADQERLGNFTHQPHYAEIISVRKFGDKASEIRLNIDDSGLQFLPGDRCSVLPENNDQLISMTLAKHQLNGEMRIQLNDRWKHFFLTEIGREIDAITLGEWLKYLDLTYFKCDASTQSIQVDQQYPLSARQYSQSSTQSPNIIRLTVGQHSYHDGKDKLHGIASSYLIKGEEKIRIKKNLARHFHVPDKAQTPILMFAAGTGIAPFLGFIEARQKHAGRNWLFYSTQNHQDCFYYKEELLDYLKQDALSLSVIFSRDEVDTLSYNHDTNSFDYQNKYKTKHIDALIKAERDVIAELIIKQNAHVYLCGNSGFSNMVRAELEQALLTYLSADEAKKYIDTMIADHKYNTDVFSFYDAKQYKQMFYSEVAYHNKENDCWVIINKQDKEGNIIQRNVYDMTQFMHVHPGGKKIIQVNAGLDATDNYRFIQHHNDQQIEAMLAQYQVGVLVSPDAGTLYTKLVGITQALTRMENILAISDATFMENPPPYVWRHVLVGLFVSKDQSQLAPWYALMKLLSEMEETMPLFMSSFNPWHAKAQECAQFIFNKGSKPLFDDELQDLKLHYDALWWKMLACINQLKWTLLDAMKLLEAQPEAKLGREFFSELQDIFSEYVLFTDQLHARIFGEVKLAMKENSEAELINTSQLASDLVIIEEAEVVVEKKRPNKMAMNKSGLFAVPAPSNEGADKPKNEKNDFCCRPCVIL